ncbi:MAG: hypothetical protein HN790_16620 [Methylococcales bacterium]|jgi:hypothetical protein|nr:hypothetical protein [Methylococcales bacterium]
MKFFFAFIVGLSLSIISLNSFACSCAAPLSIEKGAPRALQNASAVFVGVAEKVILADPNHFGDHTYTTFKITEAFKGPKDSLTTKIITMCCLCGYSFKEGDKYLVYSGQRKDGSYNASTCGRTKRANSDTEKEIEFLRNLAPHKSH